MAKSKSSGSRVPRLGTVSAVARAAGITVDQAAGRIKHREIERTADLITGKGNSATWALYDLDIVPAQVTTPNPKKRG